jgi:transposase
MITKQQRKALMLIEAEMERTRGVALLGKLKAQISEFDRQINAWHRPNETSRRLDELPGVSSRAKAPRRPPAAHRCLDRAPPEEQIRAAIS